MIYFAHYLNQDLYGQYQNFWVQLIITSTIAGLGLGLLLFNFTPEALKYLVSLIKPQHYAIYTAFLIIMALFFTYLRYYGYAEIFTNGYLYIAFFIAYVLNMQLESFLIAFKQYSLLIWTGFLYSLIFISIGLALGNAQFSVDRFVLYLLPFLILKLLFMMRACSYLLKPPLAKEHIKTFPGFLSLWIHLIIYDFSNVLFQWLDKFIISLFVSSSLSALYFNGTVNIPFVPLALGAVGSATLMQLNLTNKNADKVKLMLQAGRMLSCIAFPLFFFLLFFRYEFITVVFSTKYAGAVPIFLCSILVLPVRAYNNTVILQNFKKGKIINIGALLDFVVALSLLYPLYLWMGLPGIALSFVISTYVQVMFYLYFSAKLLKVKMWFLIPLKNWAFKVVLFSSICWFAYEIFVPLLNPTERLLVSGAIVGLSSLLLIRYELRKSNRG